MTKMFFVVVLEKDDSGVYSFSFAPPLRQLVQSIIFPMVQSMYTNTIADKGNIREILDKA